ncbi:hypothetical protein L1987_24844 [Smallanthus sonchifolius]|uniref:Uncharacterized protein n=1 Tax=Smallanthus sonchifolius TaxID=185202 RepID=A0ACB9IM52_9ASTR|nr:hypothetical protein L1987_24844 [Smallanthus sonchifolius]
MAYLRWTVFLFEVLKYHLLTSGLPHSDPVIPTLAALFLWSNASTLIHKNCVILHRPSRRTDDEVKAMFDSFIVKYEKCYKTPEEKEKRFQNFSNQVVGGPWT